MSKFFVRKNQFLANEIFKLKGLFLVFGALFLILNVPYFFLMSNDGSALETVEGKVQSIQVSNSKKKKRYKFTFYSHMGEAFWIDCCLLKSVDIERLERSKSLVIAYKRRCFGCRNEIYSIRDSGHEVISVADVVDYHKKALEKRKHGMFIMVIGSWGIALLIHLIQLAYYFLKARKRI